MGARSLLYTLLFLVAATIAAGYATAWFSREACIDDAWREIAPQRIVGRPMGAPEQPLRRSDLEARVVWPFRVEVSYLVPEGLESTVYVREYEVLPWKRSLRRAEHHVIESAGVATDAIRKAARCV